MQIHNFERHNVRIRECDDSITGIAADSSECGVLIKLVVNGAERGILAVWAFGHKGRSFEHSDGTMVSIGASRYLSRFMKGLQCLPAGDSGEPCGAPSSILKATHDRGPGTRHWRGYFSAGKEAVWAAKWLSAQPHARRAGRHAYGRQGSIPCGVFCIKNETVPCQGEGPANPFPTLKWCGAERR